MAFVYATSTSLVFVVEAMGVFRESGVNVFLSDGLDVSHASDPRSWIKSRTWRNG
jgi:hypothetical protein